MVALFQLHQKCVLGEFQVNCAMHRAFLYIYLQVKGDNIKYDILIAVGRLSRFVTINSTSIKPSIKVRNLTYYIFGESL